MFWLGYNTTPLYQYNQVDGLKKLLRVTGWKIKIILVGYFSTFKLAETEVDC